MSLEDDIVFFEQVPTFAVLGKQALRILAIGAESRRLPSGAVLFYAGELADGGYVVQEGSLLLEPGTMSEGKEFTVGPGTLVGELALLTDKCVRQLRSRRSRPW
jgi:CRP-like cAMP-binding protein